MNEFDSTPAPEPAAIPAGAPAETGGPGANDGPPLRAPERPGPPWEDASRGAFERYFTTLMEVFGQPGDFFSAMRVRGPLVAPLIYGVIGLTVGKTVSVLYSTVAQMLSPEGQGLWLEWIERIASALGLPPEQIAELERSALATTRELTASAALTILLAPLMAVVVLLAISGVMHLTLLMLGGAKERFEATFRVTAYTMGSLAWLQLIPFCGWILYLTWAQFVLIIGLINAHGTTTRAATGAVLLPQIAVTLCCCCAMAALLLAFVR